MAINHERTITSNQGELGKVRMSIHFLESNAPDCTPLDQNELYYTYAATGGRYHIQTLPDILFKPTILAG